MLARRFVPPEMADAIRNGVRGVVPCGFSFHVSGLGAVTAAIERVGGSDTFVSIDGDEVTRQPMQAVTARACRGLMKPAGEGTVIPFEAECPDRGHLAGRLFTFTGGGTRAMVELASLGTGEPGIPDWAVHLPDAGGLAAYVPTAPAPDPPTPGALSPLSALFASGKQRDLGMTALANACGLETPDPWEVIEAEARYLGMALSRDKADVRTALAPLATLGDARDLMARVTPMQAGIMQRDGRFVLLDKGTGKPLGAMPGRNSFHLGTDVPFASLLPWETALSLAEKGSHGVGKSRIELTAGPARSGVVIVMSGLNPARRDIRA